MTAPRATRTRNKTLKIQSMIAVVVMIISSIPCSGQESNNTLLSNVTTSPEESTISKTTNRTIITNDNYDINNNNNTKSELSNQGNNLPSAELGVEKTEPTQHKLLTTNTKSAPILRPSIEEVASELSKKYLNLERHKSLRPTIDAPLERVKDSDNGGGSVGESITGGGTSVEAEQDIQQPQQQQQPQVDGLSVTRVTTSVQPQQRLPGEFVTLDGHLSRSDTVAAAAAAANAAVSARSRHASVSRASRVNQYSSSNRKRKSSKLHHHQHSRLAHLQQVNELDELDQCRQYLQRHSTSYQSTTANLNDPFPPSPADSKIIAPNPLGQSLPCSCDSGWHFANAQFASLDVLKDSDLISRVWLNCDNIQLIGSQLFTPNYEHQPQQSSKNSQQKQPSDGAHDEYPDTNNLIQFSQRDADLQVLFSQKFHYLQLSSLRSIDLSRNRIRIIKMDAFHGLENKLEFLNLANNLLGDSRAMFAAGSGELQSSPAAQHQRAQAKGTTGTGAGAAQNTGKAIFFSDELNRLKELKWLSLQSNQINQLGTNIFVKSSQSSLGSHVIISGTSNEQQTISIPGGQTGTPAAASSELLYLDLSYNILNSIPSDSIRLLDKLLILKLNNNKITHLDRLSKFPRSIRHLDLSDNLINTIRHSDLIDLPDLLELNLSGNQLRHLDRLSFVSANSFISQQDNSNIIKPEGQQQDTQASLETQNINVSPAALETLSSEHKRSKRESAKDVVGEVEILDNQESDVSMSNDQENDLDADESIFSALTDRLSGGTQPTESEEVSPPKTVSQFNSTLKLNLSRNFFEIIPGDSLLKFSNLQILDLSYNRLRHLDSSYLCSLYNLVDSLKYLDLSGNLLSLDKQQEANNYRHLNKLFRCLQKLEKLFLSTNRLGVTQDGLDQDNSRSRDVDTDSLPLNSDQQSPTTESPRVSARDSRLTINLGDNSGNKFLNTLDLSDNQLRFFPVVEQINQPALLSVQNSNTSDKIFTSNQTQLNQWMMDSRIHLEILNLNYNNIERIDGNELEHLYNIRQLHLNFNKLTSLPARYFRRFTSLDHLSVAGNKITSLDPLNELIERSMRTLRFLNLANNRLNEWPQLHTRLGLGTNPNSNQQVVSAQDQYWQGSSSAKLGDLASTRQTANIDFALESLNLEGNLLTSLNISSLFDQLIYMKSLKTLNLNYNLLNKIRSEWFKFANKNLQRLHLTGNKINSIDSGAFASNQVDELVRLDLDYNLLKELRRKTFDSMPKIRELNLAHNLIHTINSETFHQLNSLQVLKLSNNKLSSWKCEYFSYLCNSISGNINVDLATLITANHGQPPPVKLAAQLTPTQQSATTTTGATTNVVSSLVELDLSHNSLSQLRANSISVHTKLVRLNLAHNKLSFIPHDLFKATTSILNGDRQVHLISSLRYLNLAHNRIQTIDNINFKPLKNLLSLDLSYNELQSLGADVVNLDARVGGQDEASQRRIVVSNNLTNLLADNDMPDYHHTQRSNYTRTGRTLYLNSFWPALSRLRHLNLAHNAISMINQSMLSELSPFVPLNLNLSYNYLDSDSLPAGFFAKISSMSRNQISQQAGGEATSQDEGKQTYDLIFTIKLESLDLSHNRLGEWPRVLLDNHYSSMESCNLSHNRIQHLPQNSNSMIQIKALSFEFNPLSRESSELLLFEQRGARYLNLAATRLYAIQQATADNAQYSKAIHNLRSRLVNQTSQLDLIRSISKPIEAPYLRHLNLSSNQLVWLSANVFDRMHSLQTLDLSNNQLTRLHLLSNQLSHVSTSLEHLYIGSNLFTSIDQTDFNQLSRLRHLDLGNLPSLQKLNCRFLSKLTTLTSLKMFNYPQLRHAINNLLTISKTEGLSERYQNKVQNELTFSTLGSHCFRDPSSLPSDMVLDKDTDTSNLLKLDRNWYKLEDIELELFNDFTHFGNNPFSEGFVLEDQLTQLLGPTTRRLSLYGLNLTSISDTSLIGVASEDFDLKISYTSISQLPLRQILTSVSRKTQLKIDLRNNNIISIDMDALQWLDELQQINSASPRHNIKDDPYSSSSLKLASNPFRCDCQTRPLWLWLNQRWDGVELPQASDEQLGDTSTGNSANHWLKFHTVTQANDLKCFYPSKLRGKLAQHVHYNDLVCKGSSSPSSLGPATNRVPRKRNETQAKSSEFYYLTSASDLGDPDDAEDDDYVEEAQTSRSEMSVVRITRFNRFPLAINNNTSLYFLNNFPSVPFIPDKSELPGYDRDGGDGSELSSSHLGKRDHNSAPISGDASAKESRMQPELHVNTKYSKHRPNTHQKHSHFNTMTNLNGGQFGRGNLRGGLSQASSVHHEISKNSLLTDSDIMILTVASIAMSIMSLIIISVCLFKYKLDHTDREQILSKHSKLILSQALMSSKMDFTSSSKSNHSSSRNSSSHSSSSKKSSKSKSSLKRSKSLSHDQTSSKQQYSTSAKKLELNKLNGGGIMKQNQLSPKIHVLAPINMTHHPTGHHTLLGPGTQNFLMRSPTIRRMQGAANNAGDWLRYTLRAYPSASGSRRRRIFMQNNAIRGPSQLTTAKFASRYNLQQVQHQLDELLMKSLNLTACPIHEYKCLDSMGESNSSTALDECQYCNNLLTKLKQHRAKRLIARSPVAVNLNDLSNDIKSTVETEIKKMHTAESRQDISSSSDVLKARKGSDNLTFQATIEQNGGFMPPKMIQALAKRLDERHSLVDELNLRRKNGSIFRKQASGGGHYQDNYRLSSSFYQKARSMKTFGNTSVPLNSTSSKATEDNNIMNKSNQCLSTEEVPSQIPTIDVDGRFSYQAESQFESPYGTRNAEVTSRSNTHGGEATPTSTVATGQEDIFILVRDTPTSETTRGSMSNRSRYGGRSGGNRFAIDTMTSLADNRSSLDQTMTGMGSSMNDECSRTSSPIAYGFMRSSPSATTLSSNTVTTTHNQYIVNETSEIMSLGSQLQPGDSRKPRLNKPHAYHPSSSSSEPQRQQPPPVAARPTQGSSLYSYVKELRVPVGAHSDANNNNNNNDNDTSHSSRTKVYDYRKDIIKQQLRKQEHNNNNSAELSGDEQVIISRL